MYIFCGTQLISLCAIFLKLPWKVYWNPSWKKEERERYKKHLSKCVCSVFAYIRTSNCKGLTCTHFFAYGAWLLLCSSCVTSTLSKLELTSLFDFVVLSCKKSVPSYLVPQPQPYQVVNKSKGISSLWKYVREGYILVLLAWKGLRKVANFLLQIFAIFFSIFEQ